MLSLSRSLSLSRATKPRSVSAPPAPSTSQEAVQRRQAALRTMGLMPLSLSQQEAEADKMIPPVLSQLDMEESEADRIKKEWVAAQNEKSAQVQTSMNPNTLDIVLEESDEFSSNLNLLLPLPLRVPLPPSRSPSPSLAGSKRSKSPLSFFSPLLLPQANDQNQTSTSNALPKADLLVSQTMPTPLQSPQRKKTIFARFRRSNSINPSTIHSSSPLLTPGPSRSKSLFMSVKKSVFRIASGANDSHALDHDAYASGGVVDRSDGVRLGGGPGCGAYSAESTTKENTETNTKENVDDNDDEQTEQLLSSTTTNADLDLTSSSSHPATPTPHAQNCNETARSEDNHKDVTTPQAQVPAEEKEREEEDEEFGLGTLFELEAADPEPEPQQQDQLTKKETVEVSSDSLSSPGRTTSSDSNDVTPTTTPTPKRPPPSRIPIRLASTKTRLVPKNGIGLSVFLSNRTRTPPAPTIPSPTSTSTSTSDSRLPSPSASPTQSTSSSSSSGPSTLSSSWTSRSRSPFRMGMGKVGGKGGSFKFVGGVPSAVEVEETETGSIEGKEREKERRALSPTMHDEASILLHMSHIEDEEMRRVTEVAFM